MQAFDSFMFSALLDFIAPCSRFFLDSISLRFSMFQLTLAGQGVLSRDSTW